MANSVSLTILILTSLLGPHSVHSINVGPITYWNNNDDYKTVPRGALSIINPNSGVGSPGDVPTNSIRIANLKNQSAIVLGYVYTSHGKRNKSEIAAEVRTYVQRYSTIDGFFFDEFAVDCKSVSSEMKPIRDIVKAAKANAKIAWNPGTSGSNGCYIVPEAKGEYVMNFESYRTDYTKGTDLMTAQTNANKWGVLTWHVIHHTSKEDMKNVIDQAIELKANYVYVVDPTDTNPQKVPLYNKPPVFWKEEKDYIANKNGK